MTDDLIKRLEMKASVMEMGEKIAWGSDTALMREAAARIRELEATPAPVTVQEVRAALGQLLEQVYQMQGMFPNDEALELAIQDAEEALEL